MKKHKVLLILFGVFYVLPQLALKTWSHIYWIGIREGNLQPNTTLIADLGLIVDVLLLVPIIYFLYVYRYDLVNEFNKLKEFKLYPWVTAGVLMGVLFSVAYFSPVVREMHAGEGLMRIQELSFWVNVCMFILSRLVLMFVLLRVVGEYFAHKKQIYIGLILIVIVFLQYPYVISFHAVMYSIFLVLYLKKRNFLLPYITVITSLIVQDILILYLTF